MSSSSWAAPKSARPTSTGSRGPSTLRLAPLPPPFSTPGRSPAKLALQEGKGLLTLDPYDAATDAHVAGMGLRAHGYPFVYRPELETALYPASLVRDQREWSRPSWPPCWRHKREPSARTNHRPAFWPAATTAGPLTTVFPGVLLISSTVAMWISSIGKATRALEPDAKECRYRREHREAKAPR